MSKTKFRSLYGEKIKVALKFEDVSLTKQSMKDECDINNVLKRYETTGVLPDYIKENPQYGDFSDVGTFQEAMDTINRSMEQFNMLSAKVRDRFANDPVKFLAFVNDAQNIDEMVSLGLATKRPESAPEAIHASEGTQA